MGTGHRAQHADLYLICTLKRGTNLVALIVELSIQIPRDGVTTMTLGLPRIGPIEAFLVGSGLLLCGAASAQSTVFCGLVACSTPVFGTGTASVDDQSETVNPPAAAQVSSDQHGDAYVNLSLDPSGHADAFANNQTNNFYNNASFQIAYSFVIGSNAPQSGGTIPIPILITGTATAGITSDPPSSGAGADAVIALSSFNPSDQLPSLSISAPTNCGQDYCSHTNNFVLQGIVTYGEAVSVIMTGGASAQANFGGGLNLAYAYASADPVISIDPSFANASDYSILLSPDVGNSEVPLPDAAWLMLSGLGGLAALARRRKSASA
jgi:hypothetical protein